MMRRRGGTNKLKQPKKDKTQGQVGKKKQPNLPDIAGDVEPVGTPDPQQDTGAAGSSEFIGIDTPERVEIPGPSTRQADSICDFVFKRPKTPPPKVFKKGSVTSGGRNPENRRIRSKLKPGKTGFPIGASLHGLSRSEKLERRSKGKSRVNSGGFPESAESSSEGASEPEFARKQSFLGGERQRRNEIPVSSEHVISYPRQTVTKLKFPPPRQRPASEKRSKRSEDSLDQRSVKESLEICQGFSKIKIDDWYPMFDFHHSKRNAPEVETRTSSEMSESVDNATMENEDDEWEESLVYVDLEDVPDVEGLFASLATPRHMNPNGAEPENEGDRPLSRLEMKIFNMDSELPVLLLGGKYLAGHWENACGTSLFFKKKSDDTDEPDDSTEADDRSKLKNIVPEPEIPYDHIFGRNYATQDEGYEMVAKSVKVLKARYFPVVNEELKGEDVIRDADDEFDQRDFQIPPVSMVREFMPQSLTYEKYMERDTERRRQIREKWAKTEETASTAEATNIVKTEPMDHAEDYASDTEDLDSILILSTSEENEPVPGTSRSIND